VEATLNNFVSASTFEESWTVTAQFKQIELTRANTSKICPDYVLPPEADYLLASDVSAAETRARQALDAHPDDNLAKYLLGSALRRKGQFEAARAILEPLTRSQPQIGLAWRELGLALEKLGEDVRAADAFLAAIDFDPVDVHAWYALGNQFDFSGDDRRNYALRPEDIRLASAATDLRQGRLAASEAILREIIGVHPADVRALKLLADALICSDRWRDAKPLLEKCLELAPLFLSARFRYGTMLLVHKEYGAAIHHTRELLESDQGNPLFRYLMAIALGQSRQYQSAIDQYEKLIEELPSRPGVWMQHARMVRTFQPERCAAVFDRMLQRFPSLVEGYYDLATVKSFRFDSSWIARIRLQLGRADLDRHQRSRLHFVLGKLFEDLRDYAQSFEHYRSCNKLLRELRPPDLENARNFTWQVKTVFTHRFLRTGSGAGCKDTGAIFIVGLPRSGSTLVEQILSSHSAIEGLGELLELPFIIRDRLGPAPDVYPNSLKTFDSAGFQALGEEYMALTRSCRKLGKPFFTDKLPINYLNIPLIHLMLPNARIIDVRRHPLDCGFSCYKHYFPAGQVQALSRRTMGRWYVDYVEIMAHFDEIMPGKVHRVVYEQMVEDPETEIRRLLDYLGLPFEEQCLRFHETERDIQTASAEQVRMPLYKTGVGHWRHYENWLAPMKEELGYVLDVYPRPPQFYPRVSARRPSYALGKANIFRLVKGVRQLPFGNPSPESAPSG